MRQPNTNTSRASWNAKPDLASEIYKFALGHYQKKALYNSVFKPHVAKAVLLATG